MESVNVIIGAGSGMGAAVARRLAPRGPVVLADLHAEPVEELAAELGDSARAVACDVTDSAALASLAASVSHLGALVITAGLSPTMASGSLIYRVNLLGTAAALDAFRPALGPESAAVCFASVAAHAVPAIDSIDAVLDEPGRPDFFDALRATGLDPDDAPTAYAFSKRGVLRLVRRLAPAWGAVGARILSLSPGIIDTPMGLLEAEHQPMMAEMVLNSPLRRTASADEVAAVAAFLVSRQASYMTGSDVLVDGGMVAVTPDPSVQ